MQIDLGPKTVYKVTMGENSYSLREPTGHDVKAFEKSLKDKKVSELDAFESFIVGLGMREDVAQNLGVTQLKKLSDGLTGGFAEKK